MEADWAAEIGPRLDHIDYNWPGFIELRGNADGILKISEAEPGSALSEALMALNAPDSPLTTCKCDLWNVPVDELDPYELDSSREAVCAGLASYVDVVVRDPELFASFAGHEAWSRAAVMRLRAMSMPNGRADLVIRAAITADRGGFGLTLYATGCGVDAAAARAAWEPILREAVAVTMSEARTARASSSIG
ncbi:MAG TPA: hypothetical protein VHX60_00920 [Acidobacteriaceae bacterium]|nr:hypothetical protein [Acidobacteriaceae bacterium]